MVRITFIAPDGSRKDVEATVGDSIMQTALAKGVTGIVAECGGCLSCATCHSYVSEEWIGKLPEKSTDETTMVECAVDVRPTSRLTCQIIVTDALDGLVVEIPKSQY
jgi:2Fe-2S ferredoxin